LSDAGERYRAFIALELPEEARRVGAAVQSQLRRCRADVRWVDPANLHVTMKFLGDVEPVLLGRLAERLGSCLEGMGAVPVGLEGVGAFPGIQRPRVIWVGVREDPQLTELHRRVTRTAAEFGFEPEDRPFRAHATLGRVREPGELTQVLSDPERRRCHTDPEWVAVAKVMRSQLTPKGAVYTTFHQLHLNSG